VQTGNIGFAAGSAGARAAAAAHVAHDSDFLRLAQSRDIIDYGMEPEFVGRLPVRVACQALTAKDLEQILVTSEGSILQQYRADFSGYGIDFEITPPAVAEIAEQACKENTGARGLMTVLERIFRNFKFELPSTAVKTFRVDEKTSAEPEGVLRGLLKENAQQQRGVLRAEVEAFAQRFQQNHGFELAFDEDAIDALIEQSLATNKTMRALCEDKFRNFHHGLKLLATESPPPGAPAGAPGDADAANAADGTPADTAPAKPPHFAITRDVVENPDKAISRWVVERFKK
jgi:ATP-dependent protease Clp ATPase subunit